MSDLKPSILIVDDETSIRESFSLILQDEYNVLTASSGEAGLKKIVDTKIDLVFLDIRMPGMDGMETLRLIKSIDDAIEVVMVTAVNDVQKAAESVHYGANNYIVKPFDVAQIMAIAKALVGKKYLKQETNLMVKDAIKQPALPVMSGHSKVISGLLEQLDAVAKKDSPVILVGENGTEKPSIAVQIHAKSGRKPYPLKQIEIPSGVKESLLYKELFGEGKGSFIYELGKGIGLIEKASGGTVLINGIENIPAAVQEKLVEAIEKKQIKRQGSLENFSVNVRFILSTTKDPGTLAENGVIDQRLLDLAGNSVVNIPPLRTRKEDIPMITAALLEKYNSKYDKNIKEISPDSLEVLSNYDWPGNYHELKNLIKRLVSSETAESVKASSLPFDILANSSAVSYIEEGRLVSNEELSSQFEKEFILQVLKKFSFDVKNSSRVLNISPAILSAKIENIQIA